MGRLSAAIGTAAAALLIAGTVLFGVQSASANLPGAGFDTQAATSPGPVSFAEIVWATRHTAYQGRQETTVAGPVRTASFVSRVQQEADGRRNVVITAPRKRMGEVQFDDGSYIWHYFPRRSVVEIKASETMRRRNTERRQPVLAAGGSDIVAGRAATIYTVTPIRAGAPTLRIWVDNASDIILRTDWANRNGAQISERFVEVEFGPPGPMAFHWPAGARLAVRSWQGALRQGGKAEVTALPLALPRIVPKSSLFDGLWMRDVAGRSVLFLHFHSGRHEASIFETVGAPAGALPGGANVDNWNVGPLNITLVSDLPPAARRQIRQTMRMVYQPS